MTALADRVKESTTTTGTGSLTLSGAVPQFESFSTAFGTGNPFYYVITDANGTDWEVGTGELSNATTLVRTTVHQSSNADAKISLSSGTHTVFCSAPAVFLADLASKMGKLSQFAATTSAELAGVISDETGSGALVFATSPTLTTPNIGVATATSVNGTTIPASKTLVVTTDKLSALAATTSAELAGVISDETGTGSLVFATSPTLTTPNIGAATATSINSTTIPTSKTLVVTTDKLSALAATTSAELAGVISDETGSGSLVFATSPALTTPNIGTPSAGTLTNCTGLPVGGVSGLGTGVGTALAVNTGSAGAFVVNGGALGTPSSGTVTNLTGTASININGTVGATTPTTGAFTTLSASSTVSGTGFSTYLASPPAIGATAANTGAFTSITSTSASGISTIQAATQDGVKLLGRAGGTGSYAVTLTPTTLSASRTLTLPDNTGTVLTTGATVTTAQGGTGLTSFTANGVVYASSTSALATGSTFVFDGTNVGIGTSSPSALLDVNGNVAITGTARKIIGDFSNATVANRTLFQTSTANATTEVGIVPNGTGTAAVLNIYPNSDPSNTGYMRLACLSTDVRFLSQVTGSGTFLPMTFYVNGERMRIDSSGNVGIGTSSPQAAYRLTINGVGTAGNPLGGIVFQQGGTDVFYIQNTDRGNTTDFELWNPRNGWLRFGTNNTERMRITAAGSVVAGASAALATNATDGFLYVPTCAGTPTGTPTTITGMAPIVVNTTNNKLYFYSGGAWRDAGP